MLIQTYEGKSITEWAMACKARERDLAAVQADSESQCRVMDEQATMLNDYIQQLADLTAMTRRFAEWISMNGYGAVRRAALDWLKENP